MLFWRQIAVAAMLLLGSHAFGQQVVNLPLQRDYALTIDGLITGSDESYHTGMKPLLRERVAATEFANFDADSNKYYYWITLKLFKEHLIEVKDERFYLTADPLFNFEIGADASDTSESPYYSNRALINNTRGFIVEGVIGKRFGFSSWFYENQTINVDYLYDYARETEVYPGQGRVKQYRDSAGWDYAMSGAYISYSPTKRINLQFGHDKHFIGDGYRSLMLSDNSFNYPSLKYNIAFGKDNRFQYSSIFASMQDLERFSTFTTPEALFKRKMGSFHYLSANITKKLQVGLFEGIIWQRVNNEDESLVTPTTFYIPVLGVNTGLNGFDGVNNAVVGLNFKWRTTKKMYFYGQYVLDDPSTSRFGFQVGAKFFDLWKVKDLVAQVEYNQVAPYTFSHQEPLQNYSHYNQAIGHQLGAGFNEVVVIANYKIPDTRFWMRGQVNVASYESDTTGTFTGQNIFLDYDNATPEVDGLATNLVWVNVEFGYQMLKWTNMQWAAGVTSRTLTTDGVGHQTTYIYFGLRTNLMNRYYDF